MSHPNAALEQPEVEQAARAPITAPEAGFVHDARPDPRSPESGLVPTEKPVLPTTPQSITEPMAAAEPAKEAESADVRVRAEKALAEYLHGKLDNSLQDGLQLDLLPVVGYGGTGIKLCFHGPEVTTKAPMLNEALIDLNKGLLTQHPVLSKFFHNVAELPKIEAPSDGSNMYHVIIPMTVDTYQQTLKELADAPVAVATAPQSDAIAEETLAKIDAPQKKEHAAELPAETMQEALPQNVVQAPVAALDKAMEQEQAQGVAR